MAAMDIPTLRTARLLLRPYRPDDFEAFAAMQADAEVMRYITAVQDRPTAFRAFCANIGHWAVRGFGPWAVEEVATGKLVGHVGLVRWEGRPAMEVGYAVYRSAWGKGYASEAAAASLSWAHEVLGARGVVGVIHPANAPSIRVAERLGARVEGEQLEKGERLLVYRFPDP
jgi:RimJ/RimL family protein N-acetyltransferase